jgi:hypothetical protein
LSSRFLRYAFPLLSNILTFQDPEKQPKGGATVVLRPKSITIPYKPVTALEAVAVANGMNVDDRGQPKPTIGEPHLKG